MTQLKDFLDVQSEVLAKEVASVQSSSAHNKNTSFKQESHSQKASDANDVKKEANESHDASSSEDGVSSYNRYREQLRKTEKLTEEIESLKQKFNSMSGSEVKSHLDSSSKTAGLTEEQF